MFSARTPVLLGRWGTRDFLRGRTKRGGAVHIRHTHGSKGRYKRLSTLYGLRDGRRHAGNRLKGGLGVKLGGGLFGLRIPRQHALSTMTKEQFDLEVYGHPNITNPYRELMEEHPALRQVMANAAPRAELVVLMPRAPRHPPSLRDGESGGRGGGGGGPGQGILPPSWRALGASLATLLSQPVTASCVGSVRFCTLDSTVHYPMPPAPLSSEHPSPERSDAAVVDVSQALEACLAKLYGEYRCGRRLRLSDAENVPPSLPRLKPFLGGSLRADAQQQPLSLQAPGLAGRGVGGGLTCTALGHACESVRRSSASARLDAMAAAAAATQLPSPPSHVISSASTVTAQGVPVRDEAGRTRTVVVAEGRSERCREDGEEGGVADTWRRLKHRHPDALCLCFRPSSFLHEGTASHRTKTAANPASGPSERAAPPTPLLKKDVDPEEELGVWQRGRHPRSTTADLLKWFYSTHDPRAHSGDAIPHDQRRLPVLLLMDASRLGTSTTANATRPSQTAAAGAAAVSSFLPPSLLSRQMSEELARVGFFPLAEEGLPQVMEALTRWTTERQWSLMLALRDCAGAEDAGVKEAKAAVDDDRG